MWGTGRVEGSAGFGVRRGGERFVSFWVSTKGRIWLGMAGLNRRVPQHLRAALIATLRSSGVDAPNGLLEGDRWLMFDAGLLKDATDLERFKSAILNIRDSVGVG